MGLFEIFNFLFYQIKWQRCFRTFQCVSIRHGMMVKMMIKSKITMNQKKERSQKTSINLSRGSPNICFSEYKSFRLEKKNTLRLSFFFSYYIRTNLLTPCSVNTQIKDYFEMVSSVCSCSVTKTSERHKNQACL